MKRHLTILTLLFGVLSAHASDTVGELLSQLSRTQEESDRVLIIMHDLWNLDDSRIEKEFMKRLSPQPTEEAYYVAQYLAKKGNTIALEILNKNYFMYPISSWQWSFTVREFGRHKYAPAIPNLIESLNAASLNVVDEAYLALRVFFPDSPTNFRSLEEMKTYFEKRRHGARDVAK